MSDLTDKFTALEGQLDTQNAAVLASMAGIEDTLGLLNTALDTLNNNQATNTRYILQALQALDPCACAGIPTLIVPPTITTPITVNTELCQRIQAFEHTIQELLTVLDAASAFSVGLNFSLITNSFNEVIAGIESGSGLPVISYPEAVNLVGAMINYIAGNLFVGGTLSDYFSSVLLDVRDAMSAGTDASSMQSLFNASIDGSSIPDYVKPVIKDTAYNSIYSYYFDPGTSPDLTGYDGTVCGIGGCETVSSHSVTNNDTAFPSLQTRQMAQSTSWFSLGDSLFSTTFSDTIVAHTWPGGGTLTVMSGAGARFIGNAGGAVVAYLTPGTPYTIGSTITDWYVDDVTSGLTLSGAFTLEICLPE